MEQERKKGNLHLSQKLCWQQGIITASLKISLHKRHLNSVGISVLNMAEGHLMTLLHNHNYANSKSKYFQEHFLKRTGIISHGVQIVNEEKMINTTCVAQEKGK